MSTSTAHLHEAPQQRRLASALAWNGLYWSVRRELWENRSVYYAPLAVGVMSFFGFIVSAIGLPERRRALLKLDAVRQHAAIIKPYDMAAVFLFGTAFVVGAFYCIDALYGERRDRAIFFWKSLPVSDRTTVAAKAAIPLLVLPVISMAVIVATQFLMMLYTTLLLLGAGMSPASTWTNVNLIGDMPIMIYGFATTALWHAPLYAWLLLVSVWAKRAAFLWAIFPGVLLSVFERVALGTSFIQRLIRERLVGGFGEAFLFPKGGGESIPVDPPPTPWRFVSSPGLWLGLVAAAAFLALAVYVRRRREPI